MQSANGSTNWSRGLGDEFEEFGCISGATLFRLHDARGLSPDLVELLADARGLRLDLEGYDRLRIAAKVSSYFTAPDGLNSLVFLPALID